MKKCFFLTVGLITSLILASCQEEDFGYNSFEIAYKTNFEKVYGKIKPDQTWDFSSHNLRKLGLVGGPSYAAKTRTQGVDEPYSLDKIVLYPNNKQVPGFDPNGTTGNNNNNTVDGIGGYGQGGTLTYKYDDLRDWLTEQPAASEGDRIVFQKPNAGFTVIPFNYKSNNSAIGPWELHLVDLGGPGDGFDYKITDSSHTNGPIVIRPENIKGNFYFYVKFTGGENDNMAIFSGASSTKTHVVDGNPSLVLGCEAGGTTDYKDLGILIMVPQASVVPPVKPDDPKTLHVITDISKKYMIEDRGSTADFDFNDIVVTVHYYKDVDISGVEQTIEYTRAKLVYLCGTIPFTLTIGGQSYGPLDGKVEYTPTPGDGYGDLSSTDGAVINNNNTVYDNIIQVTVGNGTNNGTTYTFPTQGEMPLMIAVDPSVDCMGEGQNVSETWFQTYVKQQQTVVEGN